MSKSHEGFYSIYENGSWGGGQPYSPQAIPVESESLGIQQDIRFQENLIGAGRTHNYQALVPISQSPKGAMSYAFKVDDSIKVLYSHFQYGSNKGNTGGTYQYSFYPSKGNPNFAAGAFGNGSYGGTGYVYSVSILKRLTKSGTNSLFFKNGVCDTLEVAWKSNDELRLNAEFVFRSVDIGTAFSATPNGTDAGSYSSEQNFHSVFGTVLYNGGDIGVEGITLNLKNNIENSSRVGARNPEFFKFGRYDVSGELEFDFPTDGLKYIGSMIGTGTFGLSMEACTSGTSRMVWTLPNCVLTPFEVNNSGDEYRAKLPFRAFESGTRPPVQVDVYTNYVLSTVGYWDALLGARTLVEFVIRDAENGNRSGSTYAIYDRDA